jgi:Matrixin
MKFLFFVLLLPTVAQAFTLNNSIGARFDEEKVNVRVGLNPTPCDNVDLDEVSGLLGDAMDDFWNKVSTSRLELAASGSENTGDDNYWTGELCLIGGTCGGTPVPTQSDIIVTCNKNTTNFPGGSSLLALTLPNDISGKDIKGAVVLINDTNGSFSSLSRQDKVAVIAHEVGHAIGLGHSEESSALMFYKVVPTRTDLGRDDRLGVTYLYPVQVDLFGAGCFLGTISTFKSGGDGDGGGTNTFWPTALMGLLLALVFKPTKKEI